MNIVIRQASVKDLDAAAEIEAVCFPPAEAASREVLWLRILTFPESFLIAEENGKAVGFINGCATDKAVISDEMFGNVKLHDRQGAYQAVFGLDVLPDFRGKGIAAQLIERFIESAKAAGRKGVILTCKDRLINYYERFGFENKGLSQSEHGGAQWYDMLLLF